MIFREDGQYIFVALNIFVVFSGFFVALHGEHPAPQSHSPQFRTAPAAVQRFTV
jgi:hypothetical protein